MALDILNAKKVAENGLLSKIQIGGKTYEIKDLIARENIEALASIVDAINYIKNTGVYADDAAIKAAIEAGDQANKNYIDAQVGAINKFDVSVVDVLPEASASTMYILYLVRQAGSTGDFVEYITVRSGEEGAYTYAMEQIGSTAMDLSDYVTESELNTTLEAYEQKANLKELAYKTEADLNLGTLAKKNSATGTVAGQTISGVTATGTTTGSISVELQATEKNVASTGKYTPAGNVTGTVTTAGSIAVTAKYAAAEASLTKGDYTPAGTVSADFSHTATPATLTKGDYTPEGSVSVALSGADFNQITGVGTQASFTEGEFTPASLTKEDVTANYAKEGIVGSVDENECLVFTAAGIEAITASKVTAFSGGSKAADQFTANSLPTMEAHTVGVQSSTFSGTKATDALVTGVSYDKAALANLSFAGTTAEGALVTGVSYQKADIDQANFTGTTVDIAATFAGTEGDIAVAGKCHDYAVKTAEFNGAAIELNVGNIVVAEKTVTVE